MLRVTGYELRVSSYGLRVSGCELRVTGYGLQVPGNEFRVTGKKPMEPGNKLIEKSIFLTLYALPHALCPILYHSEFRLPTSEFQFLSSDLCFMSSGYFCVPAEMYSAEVP